MEQLDKGSDPVEEFESHTGELELFEVVGTKEKEVSTVVGEPGSYAE